MEHSAEHEPRGEGHSAASEALVHLVSGDRPLNGADRGRLLTSLARALVASAKAAGTTAVVTGRWLADLFVDVAPRLPIRDGQTLRAHHPGRTTEEIAEALISGAANATTAVGAAGGALATVEFAAPPTLLSVPAQLAAEAMAVAAIEVKLVAELHELYGLAAPGPRVPRMLTYLQAWADRRGVNPLEFTPRRGVPAALGEAARRQIRKRLAGRAGRSLLTLGPMFSGAVAGGYVNRQGTRKLAEKVRADLRRLAAERELPGTAAD
ncbi:hypothetical protein C3Y87_04815 [Carbonactinospora thermoautotrophica]|uniref:hypothetical protein n=1 Tax=Carbonactinospora thermoautotrophica TaxID=1469144 RepID=UPI0022715B70|nr:hypothetical protein [Carbonactinospora thermoautotrophica]MCX9190742.1 hypothetical protein [Carbonactinospora thermoautotrophica]